jgi:stage II sporulation protein P
MNNYSKRSIVLFFSILIVIMAGAYIMNILTKPKPVPLKPTSESGSSYVSIRDRDGNLILKTGLPVHKDDEYISDTNIHYVITSVSGNQAVAEIKEEESSENRNDTLQLLSSATAVPAQTRLQDGPRHMVVYHTHSDECYIPSSGTASRPGKGDIYKVGSAFADALESAGISVTHSFKKHDPHDINAYHRSRRTALQLLKKAPDAAFDIHRDSAPRESYLTLVNGVTTGRVMIVIGRSNPNMAANLEYAQRLKAKTDELHPGLLRGIFLGRGDYNQDLYPTALLFEVGTEGITLDEAENSIRCLADAVIRVPLK